MSEERFKISREEVGLLMSYATRPDRFSEDLIDRLVSGVTGPELVSICTWVGLPDSTAARLVRANTTPRAGAKGRMTAPSPFWRAIAGLLIVMVIGFIVWVLGADFSGVRAVLTSAAAIGIGYALFRLIVAMSTRRVG